jgi:heme A synthase
MVLRHARSWPALRRLALLAPVLVAAQITLGIFTVLTLRSVPVAVGHFAGAAGLWALWISAWFVTAPVRAAFEVEPRALDSSPIPATSPKAAIA